MMTVIFHDIKMSSLQWISKCAPDIISSQLSASSDPSNMPFLVPCIQLSPLGNRRQPTFAPIHIRPHPEDVVGIKGSQFRWCILADTNKICRNLMFPKETKGTWAFFLLTKKQRGTLDLTHMVFLLFFAYAKQATIGIKCTNNVCMNIPISI